MNRYLVVDFEKLEILYLNKVDMNFKENENYTSSISCVDEIDLIKTLQIDVIYDLIQYFKNKNEVVNHE